MKVYQLEITNICNLKCSFCSMKHEWTKRENGFMDIRLIDLIDWRDTDYVELQLLGEPTLHSQIDDIITKLVYEKGVRVGFSSNLANVDIIKKVSHKCKMITINDYAKKGVDKELLSLKGVRLQDVGGDFPVEDYTHTQKYGIQFLCKIPYDYVSIQWDGDVVPCPRAHGKQVVYGNLYKQTWREIIEGENIKKIKEDLLKGKDNGLCEYCWAPNCHACRFLFFEQVYGEHDVFLDTAEYKYWKSQIDKKLEEEC